jgi:hypothetical protein
MNSSRHIFSLCLFLIPIVAESQNPVFSTVSRLSDFQERKESERPKTEKGNAQSISKATERLKRVVNGNSVVKNQCEVQGHSVEVEEKTEIAQMDGCTLIVKTVKTTDPGADGRELHFTLYANLADLSTPASVEPLSFSQCRPVQGELVRVMSRTQPGKVIGTAQNSTSQPRDGQAHTEQKEMPGRIHSWNSVSPGCKQTEPNPSRFPSPPPIPGTRQCQSEVMTRNRRRRLVDDVRR